MAEETTTKPLTVRFASSNVNEHEEYCLIQTTAGGLTEVRLYEETIQHVKDNHGNQFPAELPSIVQAVGDAVREPSHEMSSYNNSVIFVKEDTTNAFGHPLMVPVQKLTGTTSGYVTTFFFATTVMDDDDDEG